MNSYLAVAIGGAVGAMLRFAISEWVGGSQATLFVNAVGSLLLGICMASLATDLMSEEGDYFCGYWDSGSIFTTMSTFSVETIELWNDKPHYSNWVCGSNDVLICPLLAYAGWRTVEIIA